MPKNIPQEIYQHFSFQEGGAPNFAQMLSFFVPEGLFINNKGDKPLVKSLAEFVSFMKGNIDEGNILSIDESEIENNVTLFGKVGHIASRYKLVANTRNGVQVRYGVNLFQIINYGKEWMVSSMCWDDYPDQRLFGIDLGKANA